METGFGMAVRRVAERKENVTIPLGFQEWIFEVDDAKAKGVSATFLGTWLDTNHRIGQRQLPCIRLREILFLCNKFLDQAIHCSSSIYNLYITSILNGDLSVIVGDSEPGERL